MDFFVARKHRMWANPQKTDIDDFAQRQLVYSTLLHNYF